MLIEGIKMNGRKVVVHVSKEDLKPGDIIQAIHNCSAFYVCVETLKAKGDKFVCQASEIDYSSLTGSEKRSIITGVVMCEAKDNG